MMTGLYEEETCFEVLFVTGILGGMAAWATGRAIAETWRPYHQLVIYMVLLGAAVRFAHFVLFEGALFSVPSYFADMLYLLAVGSIAFRVTLARRMTTQYHWLYERTNWLSWRERGPHAEKQGTPTPKE
jgi:hypothetical protein